MSVPEPFRDCRRPTSSQFRGRLQPQFPPKRGFEFSNARAQNRRLHFQNALWPIVAMTDIETHLRIPAAQSRPGCTRKRSSKIEGAGEDRVPATAPTAPIRPARAVVSRLSKPPLLVARARASDLPRNRSPGPVHERLHLLERKFAIFVGVHCLKNSFVSRLKLLQ